MSAVAVGLTAIAVFVTLAYTPDAIESFMEWLAERNSKHVDAHRARQIEAFADRYQVR